MQCPHCGYDRPRQGRCPNCGAPAPNAQGSSYSSLRDWRQEPPRGTPSRPLNSPDRSYGGRSASDGGGGRRSSGTNWGSPSQSYPRRDSPGQSYPRRSWDADERALVPTPAATGDLMLHDDRMLPALPTEEEERALGIRRPAFIPATEERKGRRPSRWRVISGIASVLLLCVGISVASGVLLQHNVIPPLSRLLGITKPSSMKVNAPQIPSIYLTPRPILTPGPKTPISNVVTTPTVTQPPNKPYYPGQITALFVTGDNVDVLCNIDQTAKDGDVISIHWIFNQVDLSLPSADTQYKITNNKSGYEALFELKDVQAVGFGQALLYYNNTLAWTVDFAVVTSPVTPTPVPPTATPSAVPTRTPTAKP
jgi:hypothetical protein